MGIDSIAAVVGAAATVIILLFGDELLTKDKELPAWLSRARWWRYIVVVPIGAALLWGASAAIWGGRETISDLKFKVGSVEVVQPEAARYTTVTRRALDKALDEKGKADPDRGIPIDAVIEKVGVETLTQTAGNVTEGSAELMISFQRPGSAKREEMKQPARASGSFADAAIQNAIAQAATDLAVRLKNCQFE